MTTESGGEGWQHGAELRRSVTAAAKRIEEIILDAELAADQIHRDAEAEAEAYLSQHKREVDVLVEGQLAQLQKALDGFRERLSEGAPNGAPIPSSDQPNLATSGSSSESQATPPPVFAYPGRSQTSAEPAPAEDRHDEALIRATQLAIKGTERDLIVDVLRREFVHTDPESIVAEILD